MTALNQRETEILKLVSEGHSYKQVARDLKLSPRTIKFYIHTAKKKLDARSSIHAVALFIASLQVGTSVQYPPP